MKNIHKILLASVFGVLLLVGVTKAQSPSFWENAAKWTGFYLAERVEVPEVVSSFEDKKLGIEGDVYQSAKTYSKIVTNTGTRVIASIPCSTWSIKGVQIFLVPSSTAATATTTISLGVATSSANTYFSSTITSTPTFATSTNSYLSILTSNGAGELCASGSYVNAVLGATNTTTNGVLSVDYLLYQ